MLPSQGMRRTASAVKRRTSSRGPCHFEASSLVWRRAAVLEIMRNNTIKQTDLPNSLSRLQLLKLRACRSSGISRSSHCVGGSVALSRAMPLLVVMRCDIFAISKVRGGVSGRVACGITRGSAGGSGRVVVASAEDAAQSHAHAGSPARWRRLCEAVGEGMFGATVGESRDYKIVLAGSHQWWCVDAALGFSGEDVACCDASAVEIGRQRCM
jgi:hypothetical protein